jgi:hypothetical protein
MGVVHLGFGLAVVASMSILIKRPLYVEQIQVQDRGYARSGLSGAG